ncbi:hypothetical protein RhiirA4_477864 [Rhizophagus irregularis]|uniref:Uncharacterized protein n=1 Tax=Rhizophagus irregularis TaxID=588596 RepID=A0A2I1HDT5_9GLOM|nr:hypothetical protein RhiirA4_477864 [Rhizophagus irregularis]
MEEALKQYMTEKYKSLNLQEYEIAHLDKDILFPPGEIYKGVRDERTRSDPTKPIQKTLLIDLAIFKMKWEAK